jgi:hypothetical protein
MSLEQEQERMREKHAVGSLPIPTSSAFAQRHYSVTEVATMWNLSPDAVRKLFHNEPGVLALGGPEVPPMSDLDRWLPWRS